MKTNKQKPSYWKDHLLSSQVKVPLESGLWDNDYYRRQLKEGIQGLYCVAMDSLPAENENSTYFFSLEEKLSQT